ncbi:MAG: hypothetical protein AAFZ07_29670, partial [Actinomycetota bacterium]
GTIETWTRDVEGYIVGFMGILTPDTVDLASPGDDITFVDPAEAATEATAALKAASRKAS